MDVKLIGRALQFHGADLLAQMKEEQQVIPSSKVLSYLTKKQPEQEIKDKEFLSKVQCFIARKSDLLFKPFSQEEKTDVGNNGQETSDLYAIMPPLDAFMHVPSHLRREQFSDSLNRDDCVTGVVKSILDSGLLVRLLCVDIGSARHIKDLDVMAYCPAKELPRLYAKESALDAFQENDIVRGIILSSESERIIMSLHERSIPDVTLYPRIGLITEDEFPVHYRRLSDAKDRSYEDLLHSIMGFNNSGNVKALLKQLGMSEEHSYTRYMSRLEIPEKEYAEGLKKWQSQKLAHQSVVQGVDKFKSGSYMEAIQHFNKALQIDESNVEALTARGALFANKESFDKAVSDFRQALKHDPLHGNAKNYLVETLLTMGKIQEDNRQLEGAINLYKQVLHLDMENEEAIEMLAGCQKLLAIQHVDVEEPEVTKDSGTDQTGVKSQPSTDVLSVTTQKLMEVMRLEQSIVSKKKHRKEKRDKRSRKSSESYSQRKRHRRHSSGSSSSSDSRKRSRKRARGRRSSSTTSSSSSSSSSPSSRSERRRTPQINREKVKDIRKKSPTPEPPKPSMELLVFSSARASCDIFNKSTVIPGLEGSYPVAHDKNQSDQSTSTSTQRVPDREVSSPITKALPQSGVLVTHRVGMAGNADRPVGKLLDDRSKRLSPTLRELSDKLRNKSPSERRPLELNQPDRYPRKKMPGRRWSSRSSRSSGSSRSHSGSSRSSGGSARRKRRGSRRRRYSRSLSRRRSSSRSYNYDRSVRRKSRSLSRSASRSPRGSRGERTLAVPRTGVTGVAELDMYLGARPVAPVRQESSVSPDRHRGYSGSWGTSGRSMSRDDKGFASLNDPGRRLLPSTSLSRRDASDDVRPSDGVGSYSGSRDQRSNVELNMAVRKDKDLDQKDKYFRTDADGYRKDDPVKQGSKRFKKEFSDVDKGGDNKFGKKNSKPLNLTAKMDAPELQKKAMTMKEFDQIQKEMKALESKRREQSKESKTEVKVSKMERGEEVAESTAKGRLGGDSSMDLINMSAIEEEIERRVQERLRSEEAKLKEMKKTQMVEDKNLKGKSVNQQQRSYDKRQGGNNESKDYRGGRSSNKRVTKSRSRSHSRSRSDKRSSKSRTHRDGKTSRRQRSRSGSHAKWASKDRYSPSESRNRSRSHSNEASVGKGLDDKSKNLSEHAGQLDRQDQSGEKEKNILATGVVGKKSRWDDRGNSGILDAKKAPIQNKNEEEFEKKNRSVLKARDDKRTGGLVADYRGGDDDDDDYRGEEEDVDNGEKKESLTALEMFLKHLKQNKKSQWIAEGKVKKKQ